MNNFNPEYCRILHAYGNVYESADATADINTIHNEDCETTMKRIAPHSVDIVLTSPPYDTTVSKMGKRTIDRSEIESGKFPSGRYDVHVANKTPDEYIKWTVGLFNAFDQILKKNGVVIYNISYTTDDTDTMWRVISSVIEQTSFSVADHIVWHKKTAFPNNMTRNRLTRIVEDVFVFCRKSEKSTFICSKEVSSTRKNGQNVYRCIMNYIEASNNDGANSMNKATYSSDLCEQLLKIYGKREMVVYDPFMGTGTTAVAARRLGMNYIGSEISGNQIAYANDRISNYDKPVKGRTRKKIPEQMEFDFMGESFDHNNKFAMENKIAKARREKFARGLEWNGFCFVTKQSLVDELVPPEIQRCFDDICGKSITPPNNPNKMDFRVYYKKSPIRDISPKKMMYMESAIKTYVMNNFGRLVEGINFFGSASDFNSTFRITDPKVLSTLRGMSLGEELPTKYKQTEFNFG